MRSRTAALLPLRLALVLVSLSLSFPDASRGDGPAPDPGAVAQAQRILKATGVKGGLIVHLGCGDGKLTAALRADARYLVHGLDRDPANVAKAREHIRALGLYGPVSVDRLVANHLPYVDNLVNLVVTEGLSDVPMAEVMR
ncbi:class I SAM-dependent methyltransferase, partial [bacterium]|nr:class I SAM-dependent methyltransferase [bacterium]